MGLVRYATHLGTQASTYGAWPTLNNGALTEQFVGQEFLAYAEKYRETELLSTPDKKPTIGEYMKAFFTNFLKAPFLKEDEELTVVLRWPNRWLDALTPKMGKKDGNTNLIPVDLPETLRGDIITIRTAGSYGEVMSSAYNLRDRVKAVYSDEL